MCVPLCGYEHGFSVCVYGCEFDGVCHCVDMNMGSVCVSTGVSLTVCATVGI